MARSIRGYSGPRMVLDPFKAWAVAQTGRTGGAPRQRFRLPCPAILIKAVERSFACTRTHRRMVHRVAADGLDAVRQRVRIVAVEGEAAMRRIDGPGHRTLTGTGDRQSAGRRPRRVEAADPLEGAPRAEGVPMEHGRLEGDLRGIRPGGQAPRAVRGREEYVEAHGGQGVVEMGHGPFQGGLLRERVACPEHQDPVATRHRHTLVRRVDDALVRLADPDRVGAGLEPVERVEAGHDDRNEGRAVCHGLRACACGTLAGGRAWRRGGEPAAAARRSGFAAASRPMGEGGPGSAKRSCHCSAP